MPGKIMIMAPSRDDDLERRRGHAKPRPPKRGPVRQAPVSALAAVIALAAVAGAVGGALATAGFAHVRHGDSRDGGEQAARRWKIQVARLDAEVAALKPARAGLKHGAAQFSKTNDRLDKVEKAQAEPAAKLAKLSEAVEKLRTAPPPAPAPVRPPPPRPRRAEGNHRLDPAAGAPVPAAARRSRKSPGCRPSKAGCCATSPMAAR